MKNERDGEWDRKVCVCFKSGRVFRWFKDYLALGLWLFSKRGQRGRVLGWSPADRAVFRRLRLSRTMVRRASDAYVSYLLGRSRLRPLRR